MGRSDSPQLTVISMHGDWVRFTRPDGRIDQFRWPDVIFVAAWKLDCFGFDLICVGFALPGHDDLLVAREDMTGYQPLIDEMEQRCHGYRVDWWETVAHPAFAENLTMVWERN
jgi:hypothetical protein